MESVEGKAVLPGEVAGPAVRYTIQIDNEGSDPLDLTFTTVTAFLGDAMSPALQLTQPDGAPFAGVLQPGQSAAGVYIFRVPTDQRSDVTVNVAYRVGSPAAVFQGAAPAA
ncbi:hypothetical protein [Glaciibacter flavus]|uniref:hypothetical protein n=1 Tax=Orlajensenia flava TaxID=2565934 RepID=UPI003AFF639D